jgi:hypothetical protein
MSESDIPVDARSKRQRLGAIAERPGLWMVCEGCERLVMRVRTTCPHCKAYRFDAREARIRAVVKAAMRKPADEIFPSE